MAEKLRKLFENITRRTVCKIFGHGEEYVYTVQKSDNKLYRVHICQRCWTETEKEVR